MKKGVTTTGVPVGATVSVTGGREGAGDDGEGSRPGGDGEGSGPGGDGVGVEGSVAGSE